MSNQGIQIVGKETYRVRILSLFHAVRLEGLGMKRRGRSATAIAKDMLGMSRNTPRKFVLARLQVLLDGPLEDVLAACGVE